MIDRVEPLRSAAEAAIAAARTSGDLEEARVRFLGRKAELPNLLRSVGSLPPEERGAVGRAANQARQGLDALIERRGGELAAEELDARLREDRVDVTLPGAPVSPVGRLHLISSPQREIEDVFVGLGFDVSKAPRSRPSTTTSTRSTTRPSTRRPDCRTRSTFLS